MRSLARPILPENARIAVVSPASAARPERVQQGVDALLAFGYCPVLMPHALARGPLYYAGSAAERAADLHQALTGSDVDAVFCTRGGWGSAELLPLLDEVGTAAALRSRPKVFVGYSDHTSLHTWFQQSCGMVSFYAPMVAADWSLADGVDQPSWDAVLRGSEHRFGAADGLRVLRPGVASGRLQGGCLAILEAGLSTPWAFRAEEPTILFVEDIGVKPYQWDRMLQHLRFAGLLQNVTGIVLGDMSANVGPEEIDTLEAACLHALGDFAGPVALGLRCGHVTGGNRSLALGVAATLDCGETCSLRLAGLEGDVHRHTATFGNKSPREAEYARQG